MSSHTVTKINFVWIAKKSGR